MAEKSPTVLIVEDDKLIQELYAPEFREAGLVIEQAFDGESALKMLEKDTEIAVMVLDLMLPGVSGQDILDKLKKDPSHIPVVVISAIAESTGEKLPALKKGEVVYVAKGDIPLSVILEVIKDYVLSLSRSA